MGYNRSSPPAISRHTRLGQQWRRLAAVFIGLALLPLGGMPVAAASATSFSPTSVTLATVGSSATITVTTAGVAANTNGVQLGIVHPSNFTVTSPTCVGIFAGATALSATPTTYGTIIACLMAPGGTVSGTSGDVMTFVLTRTGPPLTNVTITFNTTDTVFVHMDGTIESGGTLGTLVVVGSPSPTPTFTLTNTPTPTATSTPTGTPIPTLPPTATSTPPGTSTATSTATASPTPTLTASTTPTVTPAVGAPTRGIVPNTNPPPVSGSGQPACDSLDDTLTVSGAVTGTGGRCSSFTLSINATGPTGTVIGSVPRVFIPVINLDTGAVAVASFACGQTVPATRVVTCTVSDTVPGEVPIQGAMVTVRFQTINGTADITGTITGPGGVLRTGGAAALLPLLPPPVPLSPPPVPAVLLPLPEVPVIPEAEPLLLVAGGMAALGAGVVLRAWRRKR